MEAVFKIESGELNEELLKKIKSVFEGKNVTITITSHDFDETDYLTSNPGNKEFLTSSIASEPAVTFTPEEFEKYVDDVLKKDGP